MKNVSIAIRKLCSQGLGAYWWGMVIFT